MEEWRDIEGFENYYQVSSEGRVRSLDREVEKLNRIGVLTKYQYKGKVLKPQENTWGYLIVTLCKEGKHHIKAIHRLVAQAFIPNHDDLPQVNHKDEDKHDNRADNLEWCSAEYNNSYGTHSQRVAKAQSKQVGQYTLDGTLVKVWESTNEADRNGFSKGNISSCCNGKYKTHKGYIWRYIN